MLNASRASRMAMEESAAGQRSISALPVPSHLKQSSSEPSHRGQVIW